MHNQLNAYRETAVQTASSTNLVIMLYEGAVRFLRESVTAIDARDVHRKRHAIDRAEAIIQHLQTTLDLERGGSVAQDLDRLYSYITSRVLDGSAKLDAAPLEEAIKLLNVLLTAWQELARKESEITAPAGLLARNAVTNGFKLHV